MAKGEDRRLTFYFPTTADKERWRKLAEPLPLSHWIWLKVEQSLEPTPTLSGDDINALRKQVMDLRNENDLLKAKLKQTQTELDDHRSSAKVPMMDKGVVDLLRSGGAWTSIQLIKMLEKGSLRNEKDNIRLDVKAIDFTLDMLSNMELAEKTWTGWRWKK